MVTEAERLASRQLIPISSSPVTDGRITATHEHATDNFQPQVDDQTTTDAEKDSEQAAGQHTVSFHLPCGVNQRITDESSLLFRLPSNCDSNRH